MATDYDCWHEEHGAVDVATILKTLHANADAAKAIVRGWPQTFPAMHPACPIGSDRALDNAIITPEEGRDPALMTKLDAITNVGFSAYRRMVRGSGAALRERRFEPATSKLRESGCLVM